MVHILPVVVFFLCSSFGSLSCGCSFDRFRLQSHRVSSLPISLLLLIFFYYSFSIYEALQGLHASMYTCTYILFVCLHSSVSCWFAHSTMRTQQKLNVYRPCFKNIEFMVAVVEICLGNVIFQQRSFLSRRVWHVCFWVFICPSNSFCKCDSASQSICNFLQIVLSGLCVMCSAGLLLFF